MTENNTKEEKKVQKRIMIAEDDQFLANAYRVKLEKENFEVSIVYQGKELLDKVEDFKPHLILLDLVMPLMDGFEALKALKANKSTESIPVLITSNLGQQTDLDKSITLLTNHFTWSPRTIAAIYKDRWQIEIFFKTIKQNLKIKSFLGTSRNAVLTQVWIVMISFLILKYLEFQSTLGWSVSSIMAVLSTILFMNLNLLDWLTIPPDKLHPQKHSQLQKELF